MAKKATKTTKTAKTANKLAKAESKVSRRAAEKRDTPVVRTVSILAEVADQPQLIAVALGTIGAGIVGRRADLMRGGSRMLAAHLVATAMKSAIKHRVDRSRPGHEIDSGASTLRKGQSDDHRLNSFPSGHTAGAVAVARAAPRDIDGAAVPATLAAGAVAAAQPVAGSHHLTDVVLGGMVGWLAEAIVSAVFDRVEPVIERAIVRRVAA